MSLFWIFLTLAVGHPGEMELQDAVARYWTAVVQGDKMAALEWVAEDSRKAFLSRRDLPVRSWLLSGVEWISQEEAKVSIEVEIFGGAGPGLIPTKVVQRWLREEGRWRVEIPRPEPEVQRRLFSGSQDSLLPPRLEILPQTVKIHFLNEAQVGTLVIRNGLPEAASVKAVKLDPERFEIVQKPETVEAGKTEPLVFRYIGQEQDKELSSRGEIVVEQGGKTTVFVFEILYNHLSAATRNFFGLTEEKARRLRRGDRLTPAVELPEGDQDPLAPQSPRIPR